MACQVRRVLSIAAEIRMIWVFEIFWDAFHLYEFCDADNGDKGSFVKYCIIVKIALCWLYLFWCLLYEPVLRPFPVLRLVTSRSDNEPNLLTVRGCRQMTFASSSGPDGACDARSSSWPEVDFEQAKPTVPPNTSRQLFMTGKYDKPLVAGPQLTLLLNGHTLLSAACKDGSYNGRFASHVIGLRGTSQVVTHYGCPGRVLA